MMNFEEKAKNISLISVVPYYDKEHKSWYFHLIYTIEYYDGAIDSLVIPKTENPFPVQGLRINAESDATGYTSMAQAYIDSDYKHPIYLFLDDQKCFYKMIRRKDRKTEPQELTIEEIEEKLGYSIKIINGGQK